MSHYHARLVAGAKLAERLRATSAVAVVGLHVASAQAHAKPVGGPCAIWIVPPRERSASSRRVSLVAADVAGPVVVCVCLGSVDFRVVLCSSL